MLSEKLNLPALQSKMKIDPEGYEKQLQLIYKQFNSSLELFKQQAALNFNSLSGISTDPRVAKDLGERAMFLAHMRPFYPHDLSLFPDQLAELLRSSARTLPSSPRCKVAKALILLINRKAVDMEELLSLFMELQTLGDKTLRNLAFSHVIHSIKRMNQKCKDEAKKRALQTILRSMLKRDEESIAKASLIVLCDLHRKRIWFDKETANDICRACLVSSSKIKKAALQFLLDYEKIQDDDDDDESDASSGEDEAIPKNPQIFISKEDVYKAHHKGTTASKKKKKAKLQRIVRCLKRRQRLTSERCGLSNYSPLNHLNDPQGFAEGLFSHLQNCNERFEVKMIMLKVVARIIGLHRLILPNFYPFLKRYVRPHQRNVTNLLAVAVQACHDMVPPNVVTPLFKQIVDEFVNDKSRPEAIAVGLNVVREICLRMPLLMTEEILQDLVLYKKEKGKAVSSAAGSLLALFRQIFPSLLVKKDRGRPVDPKARPKAFGEVCVASNVSGIELLQDNGNDSDVNEDDVEGMDSENEMEDFDASSSEDFDASSSEEVSALSEEDEDGISNEDGDDEQDKDGISSDEEEMNLYEFQDSEGENENRKQSKSKKRKASDFDGQLDAADKSLRVLKKLASAKTRNDHMDSEDGILSNEDFKRIKELKAKAEMKAAFSHHGLLKKGADCQKIPSANQLSIKRVDPAKLEARMHTKMTKDERMALVKAGREERGKYQARTAVKQKKKGGMSNKQKEHKKFMPVAAKRAKVVKTRQEKKRKQGRSGKQFAGKKAWK